MKAYRVTVQLLFSADDHNHPGKTLCKDGACDVVTGLLSETLRHDGLILDWAYASSDGGYSRPELVWVESDKWGFITDIAKMPLYTNQDIDNDAAMAEGWALSQTSGTDDAGSLRIEHLDEAGVFETDPDAWVHVLSRARGGSKLHLAALRQVKENNETEFERLCHCAFGMGIRDLREMLE